MSTEELVRLARKGDRIAEEEVIKSVERMVRVLARGLTKNAPYNAEDVAQTGLMAVSAAIKTYDEGKGVKFSTYAHMCAKRRMLDEVKKDGRRIKTLNIDDAAAQRSRGSIDDLIIDKDTIEEIASNLSGFEFEALYLRAVEKLSYGEISQRLGAGRKAVDNAMARARKKAKELQCTVHNS